MKIHCCSCESVVDARLTNGSEIYPHREDLFSLPFWKCDTCNNFVGCHHKTKERTKPLGIIPSPLIKEYRKQIHSLLDPLWKSKQYKRSELYSLLSNKLGREYHTAELRTEDECKLIIEEVNKLNSLF